MARPPPAANPATWSAPACHAGAVRPIFHIALVEDWAAARAAGEYRVSTRGRTLAEVGFIHCSRRGQVERTVARFYRDAGPLVLLTIDPELAGSEVREDPVGAETFPHLYGPLPVAAVVATTPLAGDDPWRAETRRATHAFDLIADVYARDWGDELDRNPADAAFVDAFADRVRRRLGADAAVLEVGAGPAQVARRLQARGLRAAIASDASAAQLAQAVALEPRLPAAAADLARLPVRDGSLSAIAAFYCLIYGSADHLDGVFADWHRALVPGGLVAVAVHLGAGTVDLQGDRDGAAWDLTVVLRDAGDLVGRLGGQGFVVDERMTRGPEPHEMPADHLFLVARRDR